jgi:hypothetical protein
LEHGNWSFNPPHTALSISPNASTSTFTHNQIPNASSSPLTTSYESPSYASTYTNPTPSYPSVNRYATNPYMMSQYHHSHQAHASFGYNNYSAVAAAVAAVQHQNSPYSPSSMYPSQAYTQGFYPNQSNLYSIDPSVNTPNQNNAFFNQLAHLSNIAASSSVIKSESSLTNGENNNDSGCYDTFNDGKSIINQSNELSTCSSASPSSSPKLNNASEFGLN